MKIAMTGLSVLLAAGLVWAAEETRESLETRIAECRRQEQRFEQQAALKDRQREAEAARREPLREQAEQLRLRLEEVGKEVVRLDREIRRRQEEKQGLLQPPKSEGNPDYTPGMRRLMGVLDSSGPNRERLRQIDKEVQDLQDQRKAAETKADEELEGQPHPTYKKLQEAAAAAAQVVLECDQRVEQLRLEAGECRVEKTLALQRRERLERRLAQLAARAPARTPPPEVRGWVTFLFPVQIPTPRGGRDVPIEPEVPRFWRQGEALHATMLLQVDSDRPETREYFSKFPAAGEISGAEAAMDRVTEIGQAFGRLMSESSRKQFKDTPARPAPGGQLVLMRVGGLMCLRFLRWSSTERFALGGAGIQSLPPGATWCEFRAASTAGLEARCELQISVKAPPEVVEQYRTVVGPDGNAQQVGQKVTLSADDVRAEVQKDLLNMRLRRQKAKPQDHMEAVQDSLGDCYHLFQRVLRTPGTNTADLDTILSEEVSLLEELLAPGGKPAAAAVPGSLFAQACHQVGRPAAWHLRRIAEKAAKHKETAGLAANCYRALADVTFSIQRDSWAPCLDYLKKSLEFRQAIRPDLDLKGEQSLWPTLDELDRMSQALLR